MKQFLSEARVRQLALFWSALIVLGLFVSTWVRILPSIGIAGLFLTGVGYALSQRRIAQRACWVRLLSFPLVYVMHLVSGLLYHGPPTSTTLGQDLLLEAPFVLLPVGFWLLPAWRPTHLRALWLLLIGCCLLSAGAATVNYLLHQSTINQLYLHSKVMPTAPDHIRFSLLISMAVLMGAVLLTTERLSGRGRALLAAAVGLLFLFQHLLAARSGLATLYLGGAFWLLWLGWQQGRWRTALGGAGLVVALGTGAWWAFPTLQNRVTNTRDDAAQVYRVSAANDYSVTARVYSYQTAWSLVKQHPLLGVSKLGLSEAMAGQYAYQYPEIAPDRYILPHNQFIYNLTAYGILGLGLFLVGFYLPLWGAWRARNVRLLLMYLIVTLSFLVEYTLETHIGVITGLFFVILAAAPIAAPDEEAVPVEARPVLVPAHQPAS